MIRHMLTTIDNPHSPFDEWDRWLAWDMAAGYNTCGLLARIAQISHDISDRDIDVALQNAVDEIVRENVSGVHTKVSKEF